ncbi:hypothetical protein JXB27_04745, partial [Candidatus Woesearchaeota archaeon]|nr:hypothetical protein [Candidatus Woesearchaeota archaeon]
MQYLLGRFINVFQGSLLTIPLKTSNFLKKVKENTAVSCPSSTGPPSVTTNGGVKLWGSLVILRG